MPDWVPDEFSDPKEFVREKVLDVILELILDAARTAADAIYGVFAWLASVVVGLVDDLGTAFTPAAEYLFRMVELYVAFVDGVAGLTGPVAPVTTSILYGGTIYVVLIAGRSGISVLGSYTGLSGLIP